MLFRSYSTKQKQERERRMLADRDTSLGLLSFLAAALLSSFVVFLSGGFVVFLSFLRVLILVNTLKKIYYYSTKQKQERERRMLADRDTSLGLLSSAFFLALLSFLVF